MDTLYGNRVNSDYHHIKYIAILGNLFLLFNKNTIDAEKTEEMETLPGKYKG